MSSDDIRMVTQYLEVSVRGIHEFLCSPLVPSVDQAELEEHLSTIVDLWLDIRVLRYMVIQSAFHAWALLLRRLHESLIRLRVAVHEYVERETGEIVEDHSVHVCAVSVDLAKKWMRIFLPRLSKVGGGDGKGRSCLDYPSLLSRIT